MKTTIDRRWREHDNQEDNLKILIEVENGMVTGTFANEREAPVVIVHDKDAAKQGGEHCYTALYPTKDTRRIEAAVKAWQKEQGR